MARSSLFTSVSKNNGKDCKFAQRKSWHVQTLACDTSNHYTASLGQSWDTILGKEAAKKFTGGGEGRVAGDGGGYHRVANIGRFVIGCLCTWSTACMGSCASEVIAIAANLIENPKARVGAL